MLAESERFSGQQSQEVGDLRRSVDSLIQAQLSQQGQAQAPQEEAAPDFFEDPEAATARMIDNHPTVKAAAESAKQYDKMTSKTQLVAKYPDMDAIVADEAFLKWVQASPVRISLLRNAHNNFDFASADELFGNWKERQTMAAQAVAMDVKERAQTVKEASTGSPTGGSASTSVKKYRRGDIIDLMKRDPKKYQRMSAEIMQAYKEGRVIN